MSTILLLDKIMFGTAVSGRGRGRSHAPTVTLHQRLQHRVNMSNQWTCSLLFNESLPGSKEPLFVDLSKEMNAGNIYKLPSHYMGKEFEKKIVLELKLASLQAGFILSVCSSQTPPAGSLYERYLVMGCHRSYRYRKDQNKGASNITTTLPTTNDNLCPFRFKLRLVRESNSWSIVQSENKSCKL